MSEQQATPQSEEVSWPLDDTIMYATLVRPTGAGPFPGVVMVAGSGPTDRDWNSPLLPGTNGSARLIADALARAGCASLRYDKRASGPHARENMAHLIGKLSMRSHVDELAGAIRELAARPDIRRDRVFALANSEGTLHALNYQLQQPAIPLAGLVLIGAPGRAVGAVARSQLAEQAAALPDGDALLALYDQAIARFQAGEPVAPDPALPQGVQMLLQALETPANLPFARELWSADAASLLARIDIPTLVVLGKKDIQVDWQADGEPLQRAAAGHANVTFLFPEDANHVLKREPRPRAELPAAEVAAGYNAPDAILDPQAMADILAWLAAHAR
ncbi:MAG TPA: alpha/beta hydrolase [Ktedonobacterales bacterium]